MIIDLYHQSQLSGGFKENKTRVQVYYLRVYILLTTKYIYTASQRNDNNE